MKRPLAVLALLTLLFRPGLAQEAVPDSRERDREIGLNLGQAIIVGNEADRLTDSMSMALFFFKRVDSHLLAGVELGQSFKHALKGVFSEDQLGDIDVPPDGKKDSLAFQSGAAVKVLWFTPMLKISFIDEDVKGDFRPYALLGGGFYNVTNKAGTATLSGRTSAGADASRTPFAIASKSENNVGFNVGAGFIAVMGPNFELGGDLRYHYVLSGAAGLRFLLPAARFSYQF